VFHTVAGEVFELHARGEYQQALVRVMEIARAHPERAEATTYWEACCHSLLNEPDRAILVLRSGLDVDLWWAPDMLTGDPDLAPLRERDDFAAIVTECEARLAAARGSAKPRLDVYRPGTSALASPLLIVLHWRGRSPDDLNGRWLPALSRGAVVACPRSSQQLGMSSFGWDDRELAFREISDAYRRLCETERFDPARVIVGGVSQGGSLALMLALTGEVVPAAGFVAVVPAMRDADALDESVAIAARRGVRGWLISGERDHGREQAEALHATLVGAGVACRLELVAGMGHDLPDDFEQRLPGGIDFVLGVQR
jgi:predicted esterase